MAASSDLMNSRADSFKNYVLVSTNKLKTKAVEEILGKAFKPGTYGFSVFDPNCADTMVQPINNGLECAKFRIDSGLKLFNNPDTIIISLENSAVVSGDSINDVCYLMIYSEGKTAYYTSFGVEIDPTLWADYMANTPNKDRTYGQYLQSRGLVVDHRNWMEDINFGNVDRYEMFRDVLTQWILDSSIPTYPNYPKPNVDFRDVTGIFAKPRLMSILSDYIGTYVHRVFVETTKNNWAPIQANKPSINYVVGLQSRGYLIGPLIAEQLTKLTGFPVGFIPMRKIDKIPGDPARLIRESYSTEYSSDEFAIEPDVDYSGSNVLIVDDLVATGGSLGASINILKKAGANIAGWFTLCEVPSLREKIFQSNGSPSVGSYPHGVLLRPNRDSITCSYRSSSSYGYQLKGELVNPLAFEEQLNKTYLISCSSSSSLSKKIASKLNIPICPMINAVFPNGERQIEIETHVRGFHVIIVCQTARNKLNGTGLNDDIMELELIMDACTLSGAKELTIVLPYYPYSRSDKRDKPHVPIASAVIADIFKNPHRPVRNVISLDLHSGQTQGLIPIGFHNLYIKKYMGQFLLNNIIGLNPANKDEWILVSPDAGSLSRVSSYAKMLKMSHACMNKMRDYSKQSTVLKSEITGGIDKLYGRRAIILDDMADTMGTMVAAVNELVKFGIKSAVIAVSHGILSDKAISRINTCEYIEKVIVTNSLPQASNLAICPKLVVLDVSDLFSQVIYALVTGGSVSSVFV